MECALDAFVAGRFVPNNGEPKIDLNQRNLALLYDQLMTFATPEQAKFILAWRTGAVSYTDQPTALSRLTKEELEGERRRNLQARLRRQLGEDGDFEEDAGDEFDTTKSEMRAGIRLENESPRKIGSLLDLASCQVQLEIGGEDSILVTPFSNDASGLQKWLPEGTTHYGREHEDSGWSHQYHAGVHRNTDNALANFRAVSPTNRVAA